MEKSVLSPVRNRKGRPPKSLDASRESAP